MALISFLYFAGRKLKHLYIFRKPRVNGSVERHKNQHRASQNPGRRVFTPDVNNKPQANPKVCLLPPLTSNARIFYSNLDTIMLKLPPVLGMSTPKGIFKQLFWHKTANK